MRLLILSTAIGLTLVAQASANDQLALSMGMEPGVYSTTELLQLQAALDDNNQILFQHLMTEFSDASAHDRAGTTTTSPSVQQLANSIGVPPDQFTLSELLQLHTAIQESDTNTVAFILNGGSEAPVDGSYSQGHLQLAREMGVDPADYTVSELANMFIGAYD